MTLSSITHRCMILGAVVLLGSTAACDKAADDEKKANVAQAEADEKIALATKEADQKIAAARAGFMKLREDYRHTTTQNLVELDRDVDGLAAKAKQASGKARTDLDAHLAQIQAGRGAFVRDYEALDATSGAIWDASKARLDKEWLDLKALVDKG